MATKKQAKPRVVRKDSTGGINDKNIVAWFRDFANIREQVKLFASRQDELKSRLMTAVEQRGYKDDRGHYWYDLPEEIGGFTRIKRERRASESLDREGLLELVKERGLNHCVKTIEVLDEEALSAEVYRKGGKISQKEFKAYLTVNESWAFVPSA